MQLPTTSEHGAELQGKMEKLDISTRDQPGPQPGPSQIDHHPTRSLTGADGASGSNSQHHRRRDQARSSSQNSEGGVRKTSKGEVWYLKTILFTSPSGVRRKYNIITQNYNGPCSFIAICNILILREQIEILPRERKTVSYDFLAQLVGEHILLTAPKVDVSAALAMMPLTTKGMDLNPLFTSSTAFRPATTGGELALFASVGISLLHGWLVDPASPEYAAVSRVGDYDSAVNLIVEADVLTRGLLVGDNVDQDGDDSGPSSQAAAGPSHSNINLTDEEKQKVEDAVAIQTFLDHTRSQLTYHGLFTLASLPMQTAPTLEPTSSSSNNPATTEPSPPPHPELFALFRNSHLAVLYRHKGALYNLVTDQVFLNEPSVVWERLEDVDQGAAVFVDSAFERATPVGGDWAGFTLSPEALGTVDPADRALALKLQNEEDERVRRAYAKRDQERAAQRNAERDPRYRDRDRYRDYEEFTNNNKKKEKNKKDKDCVIM